MGSRLSQQMEDDMSDMVRVLSTALTIQRAMEDALLDKRIVDVRFTRSEEEDGETMRLVLGLEDGALATFSTGVYSRGCIFPNVTLPDGTEFIQTADSGGFRVGDTRFAFADVIKEST